MADEDRFVIIENEESLERYAVRPFDFFDRNGSYSNHEIWHIVSWENGEPYDEKREHHHNYHEDEVQEEQPQENS